MSSKRRYEQIILTPSFAAPIPPLGESDLAYVQRVMADIAPDWSVGLEGTRAGEVALVVVPEDGDDATGPSFVVSRQTYGFRVDQVHWETLTEVGVFASLSDVVMALQGRLVFCADIAVPASVTLH